MTEFPRVGRSSPDAARSSTVTVTAASEVALLTHGKKKRQFNIFLKPGSSSARVAVSLHSRLDRSQQLNQLTREKVLGSNKDIMNE